MITESPNCNRWKPSSLWSLVLMSFLISEVLKKLSLKYLWQPLQGCGAYKQFSLQFLLNGQVLHLTWWHQTLFLEIRHKQSFFFCFSSHDNWQCTSTSSTQMMQEKVPFTNKVIFLYLLILFLEDFGLFKELSFVKDYGQRNHDQGLVPQPVP